MRFVQVIFPEKYSGKMSKIKTTKLAIKNQKQMKRLLNKFFLSCKKATELIEKRKIEQLNFTEKNQLKIHLSMCRTCNAYQSQSETLDKAVSRWVKNNKKVRNISLSSSEKAAILKKIKNS